MNLDLNKKIAERLFQISRLRFALAAMTVFVCLGHLIQPTQTVAQEEYFPDHVDVQEMVDAAVDGLHGMTGKTNGESTLAALAIVQASKRYQQEVPRGDPVVENAIARILQPGEDDEDILDCNELYYPCLALILMAEVNDAKYRSEIQSLLNHFEERQEPNGSFTYANQRGTCDTSQTQFVALAWFVAKQHNFHVDPAVVKKTLNWLCTSQIQGNWVYKLVSAGANDPGKPAGGSFPTLSMQAAGLSSTYLLADFLQLDKRKKSMSDVMASEANGLPKTVVPYVKPRDGEESLLNKKGALVSFDKGRLGSTYAAGNPVFEKNYEPYPNRGIHAFYYLYAFERYAWFREQAEGENAMREGNILNWYDQGVEFLKSSSSGDGWRNKDFKSESPIVATSFAILFLVRSSEVISLPGNDGTLIGGLGFQKDTRLRVKKGEIRSDQPDKNLADMLEMMKEDDLDSEQLAALTRSLKKAVVEFKQQDNKSRGEIKSFLRSMVSAKNYFRRLIAVRFLGGEQDMDNVPALIYALGDPDFRICLEAHDGLRLISRRIDSLRLPGDARKNAKRDAAVLSDEEELALRRDFKNIKKEWTEWFLKIRPDADLLD